MRSLRRGAALLLALGLGSAASIAAARPATARVRSNTFSNITVTTASDDNTVDGNCSLREAIEAANTASAVDACPAGGSTTSIGLRPNTTYVLQHGELDVESDIDLVGDGEGSTVIDDENTACSQCANAFSVAPGGTLGMGQLTIAQAPTAVRNRGNFDADITTIDSEYANCADRTAGEAGGIDNLGTARLGDVTIRRTTDAIVNSAHATLLAIGLTMSDNGVDVGDGCIEAQSFLNEGIATLTHATFDTDVADAVPSDSITNDGTLNIEHSEFLGDVGGVGPAVVENAGTAAITDSAFDRNSMLAVDNRSTLTILRTRISTNLGDEAGAIKNGGAMLVTDSTIDHNAGTMSGAVVNQGRATLVDDTVTDNRVTCCGTTPNFAPAASGAITNAGVLMVRNTTVARNEALGVKDWHYAAGGIVTTAPGYTALSNSIVSDNHAAAPVVALDCFGGFHSLGYNLIGHLLGCIVGATTTGNIYGVSPGLEPLGAYGGSTMTSPPMWNSRAVDAGSPAAPRESDQTTCTPLDQRAVSRPRDGNGDGIARCDIGAVER
ncbi:MAG TPA: CSLREA domain-containing protein [Acidimicrobiia bacterium]